MKKSRKGFTLMELLIVIAVSGILSSMAMMSGSEATNIANANKIVEEFNIISAAMNMFYADNKATIDAKAESEVANAVLTGIKPYMKNVSSITAANEAAAGKYNISVKNGEWWLTYTLAADDTKIGAILKNKAAQEGLTNSTTTEKLDNSGNATGAFTAAKAYDGKKTVCMRVR